MADRFGLLEAYIHERIEHTLNDTRPNVYEELMPVLDTSGARLKKYFLRVLVEQFDRAIASELKAHRIPQKLAELETAEQRARVRQQNWLENAASVPRHEHPVVLPRLTTRELVDCQLCDSRRKWLRELNQRLVQTRKVTEESRARVERQTDAIKVRLARIQERLHELEKARDSLSAADASVFKK